MKRSVAKKAGPSANKSSPLRKTPGVSRGSLRKASLRPQIVHIGPGKLGLGFIGPLAQDLELSLTFLNRTPRTEDTKKKLRILKERGYYMTIG